jgi:hypothetical protein
MAIVSTTTIKVCHFYCFSKNFEAKSVQYILHYPILHSFQSCYFAAGFIRVLKIFDRRLRLPATRKIKADPAFGGNRLAPGILQVVRASARRKTLPTIC